ncbi:MULTISPECIES: hypothetical protein [Rahnella]|uniref:hypothetical protein n=1 Tax=Rahnella TaxID=34037 RepID=UPI0010475AF6|nr:MULTISPECIES: hypothetical protein [Rahnella]TCQ86877.1 hypothetical protein EC840_107234 [Rahnella sp. JUb53]
MSYHYSQEAKERIFNLGQASVIEFIDEVPLDLRRIVYKNMPRIHGFRQGTQAELKEKQRRLIGFMFRKHATIEEGKVWKGFSFLWEAWARTHIDKLFPSVANSEAASVSGPVFIRELSDSFPDVAREDIERLFTFSGFADNPDIIETFGNFRSATVLARDKVIDEFPIRLGKFEERIELVEIAANDRDSGFKKLEHTVNLIAEGLESSQGEISHLLTVTAEFSRSIDIEEKFLNELIQVNQDISYLKKKNSDAINSIMSKVDGFILDMEGFSSRENILNTVVNEVSELRVALSEIDVLVNGRSGFIEAEILNRFEEKLTALEGNIARSNPDAMVMHRARFYQNELNVPYINILSQDVAFNIISSNLQAVGLSKSSSFSVARLTLAAFISGQIIQFSGSLADIVAEAIVSAVGAPVYHEWRVPVGLISDEASLDFINSNAESSNCLILKGANLSAFEVYGTAIRDMVVQRQFFATKYDHLALIATWKQGPAVFPGGGMLAELGPVIDTDSLKIRGSSAKLPLINFGKLAKDKWSEIEGLESDNIDISIENLKDLLDEAGFDGGNLWWRMSNRFYTTLMNMPGGNYSYDVHSIMMSLALPWARVKGGPTEEIAHIAARELNAQ